MSLLTIVGEIWRFIKDYMIKIILGAVIIALLVVGIRFLLTGINDEESQAAYDHLSVVYQQEPAEFQAVIVKEDGTFFDNSFVFDEYFARPEIIERIEGETGIEFMEWLEAEQTLELFKMSNFRGGLANIRNSSTDIMTFRFLVAPTAEENLEIARAYADFLMSGEIPFMTNHEITIIQEPVIYEFLDVETERAIAKPETLVAFSQPSTLSSIVYGIAGFILGCFIMIAGIFVFRLTKKKITYGFDYSWEFEDQHLLIKQNNLKKSTDLETLLSVPPVKQRIILTQNELDQTAEEIMSQSSQESIRINEIQDLMTLENTILPDEFIILIYSNQTDKAWYQEQATLVHLYHLPCKIIHVI